MVYLEKRVSEKTKKEFIAMYVDVRGKSYMITYDKMKILEVFDLKPTALIDLPVGEKFILFTESDKKVGK